LQRFEADMSTNPGTDHRLDTLTISVGYDPAAHGGAAKPPVYMSSTFVYPTAEFAKATHANFFEGAPMPDGAAPGYIYARLSHPNLDMIEKRLAAVDQGEASAVFSSGMAAMTTILQTFVRPGETVVYGRPLYGGVDWFLNSHFNQFGVEGFGYTDGTDRANMGAAIEAALSKGPLAVILVETPANPTAVIADIALAVELADEVGARTGRKPLVVVDNTFLGPFLQTPLALGADLCMTSLTKYCGGHSDLLAGGVTGRAELIATMKTLRTMLGNFCDAHTAWLLLRSMETLHLRTERAMSNARILAEWLQAHPKVASVTYFGFLAPGSRAKAVYDRQCRGAGSTFSFRIKGGEAEAFRMLNRLKLLRLAVSLGGAETLICHPASTTHDQIERARREEVGIDDSTFRLSVGLEHPDDLIADLAQALEAV
jgi:cystathionine gamma-synthase/methionine-gamma-lyase